MGYINPIRYRGYYCDNETGFYYCQSRYYNPQWCRWISADVYTDTSDGILGTNMYAYCQNDPVNAVDPEGTDAIYVVLYTWGDGGLPVVGHSALLIQDKNKQWWWTDYAGSDPLDARVRTRPMTGRDWTRVKTRVNKTLTKGAQTILFEGDLTASLTKAMEYSKREDARGRENWSSYGGVWLPLYNNCLHYAIGILQESTGIPRPIVEYISRTNLLTTIPSAFYAGLLAVSKIPGQKVLK